MTWLVYSDVGERLGSLKYPEDAARLVAGLAGWTIREAANLIVWREGAESQSADESFDHVAAMCYQRQAERIARMATRARSAEHQRGPNQ